MLVLVLVLVLVRALVPEQPSGLSNHPPLPVQRTFAYGSYGASGFQEGRRLQLRSSSQSRSPVRGSGGALVSRQNGSWNGHSGHALSR